MEIKELRRELCLTQEQLANKLGVNVMTIRRWEAHKNNPSHLALEKITRLQKRGRKQ